MSPLCRAVRACAYSCRHRDTTQAAVTNRNTATPGCSANPVQVAQPVTAVTARTPRKTGLTLRSLRLVVAVVIRLPGRSVHTGWDCPTVPGTEGKRLARGRRFRARVGTWAAARVPPDRPGRRPAARTP